MAAHIATPEATNESIAVNKLEKRRTCLALACEQSNG